MEITDAFMSSFCDRRIVLGADKILDSKRDRRMSMYSREDRMRAMELCFKYDKSTSFGSGGGGCTVGASPFVILLAAPLLFSLIRK